MNPYCTQTVTNCLVVYSIILHSISIALTSRTVSVQYQLRKMFHPFFSFFLFTILTAYTLCNIFFILESFFFMFGMPERFILAAKYAYESLYVYIIPILFCCVIERLIATLMMKTYEHNRLWWPLCLSQPFAIIVVALYFLISNDQYKSMAMLAFYIINISCLGILLTANNNITSRLAGSGATLTTRYQITENIRTIRVLLPAALFDALFTLTDIIATVWFKVDHVFDPRLCSDKQYLYLFLGLTTLSAVFEYLVPISVLLSHPAYRRNASLISIYENRKRTGATVSSSIMMSSDKTLPKVVNVLGIEIASAGEQQYFENLSKAWNINKKL